MTADRQAPASPPTDRLCLSVAEAADALRVSSRQVYTLAARYGLPTVKIGGRRLVRRADLETWLAALPIDRPGAALPRERQEALGGTARTAGGNP